MKCPIDFEVKTEGRRKRANHERGVWMMSVRIIVIVVVAFCAAVYGMSAAQNAEQLYLSKCAICHAADGSAHTVAAIKMKVADLRSKWVQ